MALAQLYKELTEDSKIGDEALAQFRFHVDDLFAVLGQVKGTEVRTQIGSQASQRAESSYSLKHYLKRIKDAKQTDLADLGKSYLTRLDELKTLSENLGKAIVEAETKVGTAIEKVRAQYENRNAKLQSYIQQQQVRKRAAEATMNVALAKLGLSEQEEKYIRYLQDQIKQYQLDQQGRVARFLGKKPEEISIEQSKFKDDPQYRKLVEKVAKKDSIKTHFSNIIKPIDAKAAQYQSQLDSRIQEMNQKIDLAKKEVEDLKQKNTSEIEQAKAEYTSLEGEYKMKINEVESTEVDLEKSTRERVLNYFSRKLTNEHLEQIAPEKKELASNVKTLPEAESK